MEVDRVRRTEGFRVRTPDFRPVHRFAADVKPNGISSSKAVRIGAESWEHTSYPDARKLSGATIRCQEW